MDPGVLGRVYHYSYGHGFNFFYSAPNCFSRLNLTLYFHAIKHSKIVISGRKQ